MTQTLQRWLTLSVVTGSMVWLMMPSRRVPPIPYTAGTLPRLGNRAGTGQRPRP